MKKIAILLISASGFIACQNADQNAESTKPLSQDERQKAASDSANYTSIQWLDSTYLDLGKVAKGKVVEVAYHFKNTGNKQLIISDVVAGCGCTVPEKPEKPYAPGAEGVIKAKFDSQNQHAGEHTKYVTVTANTSPNSYQLSFRVDITE